MKTMDDLRENETKRTLELKNIGIKTWHDLVRTYFSDANDETCECILWEETSYPVGGILDVERGLKELVKRMREK